MRLAALLLGATVALSACVESNTAAPPAGSSQVGPGARKADVVDASVMFRRVCVVTAPDMAAAKRELSKMPFVQNSATGTYYHQALDLSFKVRKEGGQTVCSMVLGTTRSPASVELTMIAAGQGGKADISVQSGLRNGGRTYIGVFAISK